ncbi:hypothetical protein LWM68_33310 [Niabella sp. W65]|nr:hypothetical protein [Niabella sp. W65]MCH7367210.1 hypothetical protein [Niabella sp. W65]
MVTSKTPGTKTKTMQIYLFKNIQVVNEGKTETKDVLINNGRIERIDNQIGINANAIEINGEGKHLTRCNRRPGTFQGTGPNP